MLYKGFFKDNTNTPVYVLIQTGGDSSEVVEINEYEGDILFDNNEPVSIRYDKDIFDTIYPTECTINLLVKSYIGDDLFTGNARDIIVNIVRKNKIIFAGFIEPNVYNQPFVRPLDNFTLNATCSLATLQYYKYANCNDETTYNNYKKRAVNKSLKDILYNILGSIPTLDLVNGSANHIYYDGSIRMSKNSTVQTDIFTLLEISELLFLGEEIDDVYTDEETLHEILQYFDLKIQQKGNSFYIYSLSTVENRKTIDWYPLFTEYYYSVDNVSYVRYARGRYNEKLVSSAGTYVSGNELNSTLSDEVEEIKVDNKSVYVQYYMVTTPSQTVVKTNDYELADIKNMFSYIYVDNVYYILERNEYGDYKLDKTAPEQSLNEDGSIKYPEVTYVIEPQKFIITEN